MTLEVHDLTVSYGSRRVLGPVDLALGAGEWLGLVGPNGAGKSTLLRAVAGLVESTGTIRVAGAERHQVVRDRARAIAYVPQRPELPATMTVGDYVLLGRSPHIRLLGAERAPDRKVAAEVTERLGLEPFARRRLGELSGGEVQRVVIARALAQCAPVLLLDEPTTALDLGQGQRVLELVDELRAERSLTVVSAMHDLGLIGQFAERLALLVEGVVVADGPASSVLTEAMLEDHYGASVHLHPDGHGGIVVVPVRRRGERGRSPGGSFLSAPAEAARPAPSPR